jgi:8-oxo-dGTP pyrophosphatase MutT (NUDIX family)
MPITARHIRDTLTASLERHPGEHSDLMPALQLLDAGADLASRTEFRGHATAGAILARPDGHLLHIHHRATGRWLFPGGHLEPGDATLQDAALRELTEESGISVRLITPVGTDPLHIDIHPIAARSARGEPGHQHIDFRYVFTTTADTGQLQTEEITAAAWHPASSLPGRHLRDRVLQTLHE